MPARGGRKGGSKGSGDGVKTLLLALKKHKNFKQLSSYSLATLSKSIDPVNSDWNTNVDELVNHGGIEQVRPVKNIDY